MMKKIITFLAAIGLTAGVFAQAPNKMSYQAVVRNASGNLVVNSTVGMRLQILQTSEFGAAVYVETHSPATNVNGLVTQEIGSGIVVLGTFTGINWANGPYFIKVETDITGGTNYSITGVSQILSVPFALYAKTVASYPETDPAFVAHPSYGITGANITNWNIAYSWGNHAKLYLPIDYVPRWTEITSKPVTLTGYGITDAMSTSHPANVISEENI